MPFALVPFDDSNEMDEVEWRYFLAGPSGEVNIPANPTTWISENSWPDIFR
jgi:dynein heavy chain